MRNLNLMEISQSQSSIERIEIPEKDDKKINVHNFLGYKIFVGRNALSNEKLISEHKIQHKKCVWMHAHGVKGAHVIICLNGKEGKVDEIVFRRAMDLALWFSVKRENNKKVIWSELQDVFKPVEGVLGVWKTYKQNNVVEL